MKLSEGIHIEGGKVIIPDSTRKDFPELFKSLGFSVGAEIGVEAGLFTTVLCGGGMKVYAIDPWLAYDDYAVSGGQRKRSVFEHHARVILEGKNCEIIKKTSMEAVLDFQDNSLDFVYIDGNHSFKYVTEDIWEWTKKVRPGGIIAGHDYLAEDRRPPFELDVKYVVDAYVQAAKINKWYVTTDRLPSWFWFKQ